MLLLINWTGVKGPLKSLRGLNKPISRMNLVPHGAQNMVKPHAKNAAKPRQSIGNEGNAMRFIFTPAMSLNGPLRGVSVEGEDTGIVLLEHAEN